MINSKKLIMKKLKYIIVAFVMVLVACEVDDALGSVALSNLTINTEISNDGSGKVTWFLAAAQPGHLGLGPARAGIDGDWWYPKWYSAQAFEKCGSDISDCFCDDELTFSVDSNGDVTYVLDNKGQTFFNVGHKAVVGGTSDEDFCYDYDTSGEKAVTIS